MPYFSTPVCTAEHLYPVGTILRKVASPHLRPEHRIVAIPEKVVVIGHIKSTLGGRLAVVGIEGPRAGKKFELNALSQWGSFPEDNPDMK